MGRYRGSGVFGSLARKLFSSGFKKIINVATKANLPQKLADVVVNGAKSTGQKLGKRAGAKLGAVVRKKVVNRIAPPRKRRAASAKTSINNNNNSRLPQHMVGEGLVANLKRRRLDRFINHRGSGIILQ